MATHFEHWADWCLDCTTVLCVMMWERGCIDMVSYISTQYHRWLRILGLEPFTSRHQCCHSQRLGYRRQPPVIKHKMKQTCLVCSQLLDWVGSSNPPNSTKQDKKRLNRLAQPPVTFRSSAWSNKYTVLDCKTETEQALGWRRTRCQ